MSVTRNYMMMPAFLCQPPCQAFRFTQTGITTCLAFFSVRYTVYAQGSIVLRRYLQTMKLRVKFRTTLLRYNMGIGILARRAGHKR